MKRILARPAGFLLSSWLVAILSLCGVRGEFSGPGAEAAQGGQTAGTGFPENAAAAAQRAVAALRKLEKAIDVKMNLRDYSLRIGETKTELEQCLPRLGPGELRREVIAAMEAYMDASTAWEEMVRYDFMAAEYEPGTSLQEKYSIETSESATGRIMARTVVLNTIWKAARKHSEKAGTLAGK